MAGLVLGVMALIVVLSVFNGSQGIMRERTLITVPHGDISVDRSFRDWQEIRTLLLEQADISGVAPYINLEAMISQRGYHQVAQVKAIDPVLEGTVSQLQQHMLQGRVDDLQAGERGILLGRALASNLRLLPGDNLNLVLPEMNSDGRNFDLNLHRFTVTGIFDVQFSIGSSLAYIHIEDGADILGLADVADALQLRLQMADINQARAVLSRVLGLLALTFPDYNFHGVDWSTSEASLFNALKLEKVMTSFMLMMIVAIGAFNIVSTLVMVVSDKQADIAILRTMGASQTTVMSIFMVQGFVVGLLGTLAGAAAGLLVVLNFSWVSRLIHYISTPSDMFIISSLPAELHWSDVYLICLCALVISFLATLYPAWKASKIHPAEILRYE